MTEALLAFAGALIPGLVLAAAITIHGRIQRIQRAREDAERAAWSALLAARYDKVMTILETEGGQAAYEHMQTDPSWNTKLPTSNKT